MWRRPPAAPSFDVVLRKIPRQRLGIFLRDASRTSSCVVAKEAGSAPGLAVGDVVTHVDGLPFRGSRSLAARIVAAGPEVRLRIRRSELTVRLLEAD